MLALYAHIKKKRVEDYLEHVHLQGQENEENTFTQNQY